jgi:hypothetical protein
MRKKKQSQIVPFTTRLFTLVTVLAFAACQKSAVAPAKSSGDALVLTPAGYMAASRVHFIAEGFHLSVQNGHLQKLENATGRLAEDFGEFKPAEQRFNPRTPAHASPDKVVPYVEGWIAYTYWQNPTTSTPVTSFSTTWTVPSTPSDEGSQTIFLFNGIQDGTTSTSYIIQPVLQWGPSAAGGGKYWAVTNWYVTASDAYYGSLATVSAGASLTGVITQTAVSGSDYSYSSVFTGYPSSTSLSVSNVPEGYWLAETLESYGVSRPGTMYPSNTYDAFTGIDILESSIHPTITWTPEQATSGAAQKAVVVSNSTTNGEIEIYFRN